MQSKTKVFASKKGKSKRQCKRENRARQHNAEQLEVDQAYEKFLQDLAVYYIDQDGVFHSHPTEDQAYESYGQMYSDLKSGFRYVRETTGQSEFEDWCDNVIDVAKEMNPSAAPTGEFISEVADMMLEAQATSTKIAHLQNLYASFYCTGEWIYSLLESSVITSAQWSDYKDKMLQSGLMPADHYLDWRSDSCLAPQKGTVDQATVAGAKHA